MLFVVGKTMRRSDYDPGSPYDPPPPRRRRMGDEYDDAWAGGDDNDTFDDAAGYNWEDPRRSAPQDDDIDLDPGVPRSRRRYRRPYPPDSSSYYRDRAHIGEYGEYYEKPKRMESGRAYNTGLNIPYWQILMVVILGLAAFLVTVLACVSILNL